MQLKVFVCGEGVNDIGRWAFEPAYRGEKVGDGVIGELARREVPDGWSIDDGCVWRRLPVLRVGAGLKDIDVWRFHGALQQMRERSCDALLYARDIDGDEDRMRVLEALRIEFAEKDRWRVALAAVDPCVEAWVLELRGERRKHGWTKASSQAALGKMTTREMEAIVRSWTGETVHLSTELRTWLSDAKRALAP